MSYAPITLFVYNRPDHTRKTVEALAKNALAKESELFIFSDAPKHTAAAGRVEEVRDYIKTITGFKTVHIIERDRNWGLADSIIDGVTSIVHTHGTVIVLEDDVVTSPFFLTFMNEALVRYNDDTRVMHINGYALPWTTPLPDLFFYNQMLCWGWATWEHAWDHFSSDTDMAITVLASHRERTKKMYIKNALATLRANKRGEQKTWAAFWQAAITKHEGLCLTARTSYTCNTGHDNSGEHSTRSSAYTVPLQTAYVPVQDIARKECPEAVQDANQFWKLRRGPFMVRLVRKLSQFLHL